MTIFLTLLKSLDELLYEVISWLLFWPITLWRTLRHPRRMLGYASRELHDAPERQFNDTLPPPLFLLLAVILVHVIQLATIGESAIIARKIGLSGLINDDTNLLLLRLVTFATLPLILAARLLRRQGHKLDRTVLRPHFYAQCYAAGALAFLFGIAATGFDLVWPWAHVASWGLLVAAFVWYGLVQVDWLRQNLHESRARAFWDASVAMVECLVALAIVGALFA